MKQKPISANTRFLFNIEIEEAMNNGWQIIPGTMHSNVNYTDVNGPYEEENGYFFVVMVKENDPKRNH